MLRLFQFFVISQVIIHNLAFDIMNSIIREQLEFLAGCSILTNLFCNAQVISEATYRQSNYFKTSRKLSHDL